MALRRRCRLSDVSNRDVDLTKFETLIINTINNVVPGKNPAVYPDCFQTDCLSRGEAIRLGQALSKLSGISIYGKLVTTFRLFDGEIIEVEDTNSAIDHEAQPQEPEAETNKQNAKGGRKNRK